MPHKCLDFLFMLTSYSFKLERIDQLIELLRKDIRNVLRYCVAERTQVFIPYILVLAGKTVTSGVEIRCLWGL
jgi:hypothetical protein